MSFSDAEQVAPSRYFNMPALATPGESHEVNILVVDETPVSMWQHRIGVRPWICPGERAGCPACEERSALKLQGDEGWKALWRVSRRWKVNVLLVDRNEIKIIEFSNDLLEKFKEWEKRLREKGKALDTQVFSYQKKKSGPRRMDVDYELFPETADYVMSDEQVALLDTRYDLTKEIEPASPKDIGAAMARERSQGGNGAGEQSTQRQQPASSTTTSEIAGASDLDRLTKLVGERGLELIDVIGVGEKAETLTADQVKKYILLLTSK